MNRLLITSMIIAAVTVILSACSIQKQTSTQTAKDNSASTVNLKHKTLVTLYFANKEYVETGNEKLSKVLPEEREVSYTTTIEETVVRELLKGTSNSELTSEIPAKAKLKSVKVADDTAYVDFSSEGLSGGSLEEALMIKQIVSSLTALNNIKQVQFTIDGKVAESLMGHFDIRKPIS